MHPPVAKRVPRPVPRSTGSAVDDWHWLRDRDDPDTVSYLVDENAYADAWLDGHGDLVDALAGELRARTQETDESVPARKGRWWYLTRTVEGLPYAVHCRRPSPGDAAGEQVLLDENERADGHDFFDLGAFEVSPSGAVLAWSADVQGDEAYTLRFRDLEADGDLPDVVPDTADTSVAWSADSRHVFYLRRDEVARPFQVWRHALGTDPAGDVLVHQEDDERFYLSVELTRSEAFVVIRAWSHTTVDAHVVPAGDPFAPPRRVAPRRAGHEYSVDHWGDRFVILTNLDAEDFRVVTAPVDGDSEDAWSPLVPHEPSRRIHAVDAFERGVVLREWRGGLPGLRVLLPDGSTREVTVDEAAYDVDLGAMAAYDADALRIEHDSLATPPTVCEEPFDGGTRTVLKRLPVLGGFDPTDHLVERTWATADDGTAVPIDLVRPAGSAWPLPVLVHAYGSYEISEPAGFRMMWLPLLDRGVAVAIAHPRGGGELGRRWYLDGKLERKVNTFTDTVACLRHLREAGIAERVALRGGSAGGLLVGAVLNLAPDLVDVALAHVPFVDVVTTMHDETLPLVALEWEEWGDPRRPADEAWMLAWSPYDNVAPRRYPPLYVTAGLHDVRVSYHEPAKWVAKLRAVADASSGTLLLRTELGAGHGGPTGRYEEWKDTARELAFALVHLGATERRRPLG